MEIEFTARHSLFWNRGIIMYTNVILRFAKTFFSKRLYSAMTALALLAAGIFFSSAPGDRCRYLRP
jgi:hypothetical protein